MAGATTSGSQQPASSASPSGKDTTSLLQASSSSTDDASSIHSSPASSYRSESPTPSHRQRRRAAVSTKRNVSFFSAMLGAAGAGSLTAFSLYGHLFQERLHYSQYQVNGVAIVSSFAVYLLVPLFGYVCDRFGPAPLSAVSAVLLGAGYGLAAALYKQGAAVTEPSSGPSTFGWMIFAFILIGIGTCAIYIGCIATVAKNFGKGKHRGLALALPISAIGLSGMWQSQVGSRLLYERKPDGSKGDVDVFYFFIFLAVLLFVVGIFGTFTMNVVDEQDLIDEAVEELERSGLLDGSALFTPGRTSAGGYGAVERSDPLEDEEDARLLDPAKDAEEDARFKKNWVLNAETRRFVGDSTMWCFAAGFFFMIGPGESFINNMGTVIKTLTPPSAIEFGSETSAATHVSIICTASTTVRLLVGALTDLLAPTPPTQHPQIPVTAARTIFHRLKFSISRVAFLIFFGLLLSLGFAILASGAIQNHADRFWIVSSLVGASYGALFSITPIIVTIIWGVENFGTNWGIVATFPAVGNTLWGLVYAAVYQAGAEKTPNSPEEGNGDLFCYGTQCYAAAYWAMAGSAWIACLLVLWAWKGKNGWAQRGIII